MNEDLTKMSIKSDTLAQADSTIPETQRQVAC
jgi:hypothetical protein